MSAKKPAAKTNFQLVYKVLTELYAQVLATHGKDADNKVKQAIVSLSAAYGNLMSKSQPAIDYSDATTRFAYVYMYVASHADYFLQTITIAGNKHLKAITQQEKLVVTCLGGGPGSELVGLLQYFRTAPDAKTKVLTCYLCDREQAWADSWTEIGGELESELKLYVNFQQLDVCDPKSWQKQRKFLAADLFISNYFASEIARVKADAAAFWKDLGASAKSGALLMFVDNDHTSFTSYIRDDIAACLPDFERQADGSWELTPRAVEQTSDFGEFLKKFDRHPKLKGKVFASLYRKK